jgi:hypothetical protein
MPQMNKEKVYWALEVPYVFFSAWYTEDVRLAIVVVVPAEEEISREGNTR